MIVHGMFGIAATDFKLLSGSATQAWMSTATANFEPGGITLNFSFTMTSFCSVSDTNVFAFGETCS